MKIGWRFPLRNGGNETGYTNQGIEGFKGEDLIDNVTREICQNSLDAGIAPSKPVIVKFSLVNLQKNKYDIFKEFEICIDGCKEYWGSRMDDKLSMFIDGAERMLAKDVIPMLVASDSNTKGLTGVNATRDEKSTWRGLVQSDGTSVNKTGDSAGSYGIGKNAPFACSSLSMVLYNTYAIDEIKAFQGVARVATLIQNGKSTQSIGHYKVIDETVDEDTATPITSAVDNCAIRDVFSRNEYGTDVGIVGFSAPENWKDNIIKAVLKNFFLALKEEKLIVKVESEEISNKTLEHYFNKYSDDKKVRVAYEMYSAVVSPDKGIYEFSIIEEKDVNLYLKVDNSYNRNIGNFRNSGMLVGQYRKNMLQRFAAVVVIRGKKLGKLLKNAEPAKHNKWDANIISDPEKRKKARAAIKEINLNVDRILNGCFSVPMEKSVDSDMGEFLPCEIGDEGLGEKTEGKDKLRVRQKIAEIKHIPSTSKSIENAARTTGTKIKGIPGNSTHNPTPGPGKTGPVDPSNQGKDVGTGKSNGEKYVSVPKVIGQRVSPRNYKNGVYHSVIKLEKDSSNIYLQFHIVDADNNRNAVLVKTYVVDGIKYSNVNKSKIGPISFEKNIYKDISLILDCNEKVVLDMSVTEESVGGK